jgi:hypothetical protein
MGLHDSCALCVKVAEPRCGQTYGVILEPVVRRKVVRGKGAARGPFDTAEDSVEDGTWWSA